MRNKRGELPVAPDALKIGELVKSAGGLTIREHAAIQLMAAFCSRGDIPNEDNAVKVAGRTRLANIAVEAADALLAALEIQA